MKRSFSTIREMRVPFFLTICLTLFFVSAAFGQQAQEPSPTSETVAANDANKSDSAVKPLSGPKVTFDTNASGIVIVESHGETIRIDTIKKTFEVVSTAANDTKTALANPQTQTTEPAKQDNKKDPYEFNKGQEPYASRIVNMPTPKHVPKGTWNLDFTHRFTEEIHPLKTSVPDLLGMDSFAVASFGMTYGITDKLYASAYRSPVCQRGLCKDIEIGVGYNWLAHDKHNPIALTTYASVEGNDNFTEEYTYNIEAMFSARVTKRIYLFFSPAAHINSNGQRRFDPRPTDFFPAAPIADTFRLPTHGATFGFGTSILITRNVVALFDVAARTGFQLGRVVPIRDSSFHITGFNNVSYPSMGFGIQRNIGQHSFALTFSNTQTTTTSRYNSSNLVLSPGHVIIGFNLTRRF